MFTIKKTNFNDFKDKIFELALKKEQLKTQIESLQSEIKEKSIELHKIAFEYLNK